MIVEYKKYKKNNNSVQNLFSVPQPVHYPLLSVGTIYTCGLLRGWTIRSLASVKILFS